MIRLPAVLNVRRLLLGGALVLVCGFVLGCTSTVRPPGSVIDPVTTYLLLDDMHRGIWLPQTGGGFVEYGYGDWDWYAANQDRWYDVFDTILWPTQGAVGRRTSTSRDGAALQAEYHWMVFRELVVERPAMVAMRTEFERLFVQRSDKVVWNERYAMSFVPVDEGYWFAHNCNDEVAEWLERLGCAVSWVPIRLGLKVE